ncbi:hypothetical protein ALQ37_200028 [Pseudomonas syringae pv. aptata]|uniref:Uncharacterized protein n=1 Tax=Pseudomonas syringae pv. aptata TaxID=83167 RepID=A0A3M3X6A7_PSEAP|nr:hypothetical protein ALQ37_200028 [Pseudomonas syringae pv. aptata]
MKDSDYTKGTVRKPSKYKRDMTKFSNRDALSKEERAILESMNPKIFILDGIPYTEEELIHLF